MTAPQPTLADFLSFIRTGMNIDANNLPDNSIWIPIAFANALAIVNPALKIIPIPQYDAAQVQLNSGGFSIYSLAVYNLAADNLVNYAQDQQGRTFFTDLRKELNLNGFVSGVVTASADESTSVSIVVQDAAKNFTLANLQQLKTPWGRAYLSLAQSAGPETWGIS